MSSSEVTFIKVTSIYYPIYLAVCVVLQTLLFYLISTKTPQVLKHMTYFFYPTNLCNFLLAITLTISQIRLVRNKTSLAVLCAGPVNNFGALSCFYSYSFSLVNETTIGLLNIHTLFYKSLVIRGVENKRLKTGVFSLMYLFAVAMLILTTITPIDFDLVFLETLEVHPTYVYEPYGDFGGFAPAHATYNSTLTNIAFCLAFLAPIFGTYWMRLCVNVMKSNQKCLSEVTLRQLAYLLKALQFQILIPLMIYIPTAIFFILNKYTGAHDVMIAEFLQAILLGLSAFFDPLIIIYYVLPYRRTVQSMLSCRKKRDNVASSYDIVN